LFISLLNIRNLKKVQKIQLKMISLSYQAEVINIKIQVMKLLRGSIQGILLDQINQIYRIVKS